MSREPGLTKPSREPLELISRNMYFCYYSEHEKLLKIKEEIFDFNSIDFSVVKRLVVT